MYNLERYEPSNFNYSVIILFQRRIFYAELEEMADRRITGANYITSVNGMVHPNRIMDVHDFLYILDGEWKSLKKTRLIIYQKMIC